MPLNIPEPPIPSAPSPKTPEPSRAPEPPGPGMGGTAKGKSSLPKKAGRLRSFYRRLRSGPQQSTGEYKLPHGRNGFAGFKKKSQPKRRGAFESVFRGAISEKKKDGKVLEKDGKISKKSKLPYGGKKLLKRKHFKKWLGDPKRSQIYQYRLPRHKLIERGEGLLPPRTGTGYIPTWQVDKILKNLRTREYKAQTLEEKAEIKKDIKLFKEYKKDLEAGKHN